MSARTSLLQRRATYPLARLGLSPVQQLLLLGLFCSLPGSVHVCECVHLCVHLCAGVHVCAHMSVRACKYVVCVHLCVCMCHTSIMDACTALEALGLRAAFGLELVV